MQSESSNDPHKIQNTIPQQTFFDGALGEEEGEGFSPDRIAVRFISRRTRLIDPDNLTPKYLLDGLRYSGLIYDDRAQDITVQVEQEKAQCRAVEETVIEITYLDEEQIVDLIHRAEKREVLGVREKEDNEGL